MKKSKRKIRNYDLFSQHAYYTCGVSGMFVLLGLLLVGAILGSLVTLLLTQFYGSSFASEYGMLISYPLMFVPPMMFVGMKSRYNAVFDPGYALDSRHWGPYGPWGCALLVTVAVLATGYMSDALLSLLPPMPDALKDALESMTTGTLWVNLLCVSILAPICEEWLCRGMVLRGLLNTRKADGSPRFSPAWAIVISAFFFAFIHFNPWQALPAFILGSLFGYVYYRTGSLKLTMLMHCVNNTFAVLTSRMDAFADANSWTEVLPPVWYWVIFAVCAGVLAGILRAFSRIELESATGNCDPLSE